MLINDFCQKRYSKNNIYKIEKKTKIALNQVFVPKLALKVKSHKNSTT